MTAFSKVSKGKVSQRANKKDGGALGRQRNQDKAFCAAGFTRNDWNKWNYTWPGEFPIFEIAPGIIGDKAGLVAHYEPADIEILFAYGTTPADIKAQLDDKIDELMGLQADVADPTSSDYIPFLGEPVTIVEGQGVGPEIDFDAWMVAGA